MEKALCRLRNPVPPYRRGRLLLDGALRLLSEARFLFEARLPPHRQRVFQRLLARLHGSLVRREQPRCEFRFRLESHGIELPIRFAQCAVPDSLLDVPDYDVGVIVEGQLESDGVFQASSALTKPRTKRNPA